jgi:hypothetical protein
LILREIQVEMNEGDVHILVFRGVQNFSCMYQKTEVGRGLYIWEIIILGIIRVRGTMHTGVIDFVSMGGQSVLHVTRRLAGRYPHQ